MRRKRKHPNNRIKEEAKEKCHTGVKEISGAMRASHAFLREQQWGIKRGKEKNETAEWENGSNPNFGK